MSTLSQSQTPEALDSSLREHRHRTVERLTDRLETPSIDDRSYRVIKLPNQLEVLLVHDSDTDKASAAMDVNVGNFSDEEDLGGMAHAVEHLLFMGTKKYPIENAYSQYLSAHSGSSNTYTSATSTNYYFEVTAKAAEDAEPSPLYGALDRFAQFFIEPLFLSSTFHRELRAVDSENTKNLQDDQWRLHQLEKSLSNPKHPYCHFRIGNFEVLKTDPEAWGVNVRQKFMDFHEKHYSANRMKLVILGREPLDILEGWAADLFAGVRNKRLQPNHWEDEEPFGPNDLLTQCFSKPVMDSRQLDLSFPFIKEELCESQPGRYVSHLIGHKGPGSIMSYIKSKGVLSRNKYEQRGEDNSADDKKRTWYKGKALKHTPPTIIEQVGRTIFNPWTNILLLAPIGLTVFHWEVGDTPCSVTFLINFLGIIPLAAVLSFAIEDVASRVGETVGGLLNVVFRSAAELVVNLLSHASSIPKELVALTALATLFDVAQAAVIPSVAPASSAEGTTAIALATASHIATTTLSTGMSEATASFPSTSNYSSSGVSGDDDVRSIFRHKGVILLISLWEFAVAVFIICICLLASLYCIDELQERDCHKKSCMDKNCERKKCSAHLCHARHCPKKQKRLLNTLCTMAFLWLYGFVRDANDATWGVVIGLFVGGALLTSSTIRMGISGFNFEAPYVIGGAILAAIIWTTGYWAIEKIPGITKPDVLVLPSVLISFAFLELGAKIVDAVMHHRKDHHGLSFAPVGTHRASDGTSYGGFGSHAAPSGQRDGFGSGTRSGQQHMSVGIQNRGSVQDVLTEGGNEFVNPSLSFPTYPNRAGTRNTTSLCDPYLTQ